jgi:hypothetical protein
MHAPRIDPRKSGPIRGVLQESLAGLLPSLAVRIAHNRRADVGDGEANKVGTVADRLEVRVTFEVLETRLFRDLFQFSLGLVDLVGHRFTVLGE